MDDFKCAMKAANVKELPESDYPLSPSLKRCATDVWRAKLNTEHLTEDLTQWEGRRKHPRSMPVGNILEK